MKSNEIIFGESIEIDRKTISSNFHFNWGDFCCENPFIDDFLRHRSNLSRSDKTHVYYDTQKKRVIAAASLACSSIPIMSFGKYNYSIPSVEITYFGLDKNYKKMPQSPEPSDGYLSDYILNDVINMIYNMTDEYCAATHVIAYSTPDAVHFYERNGFREFDSELFLRRENHKIDGCIPMYYTL